MIQEKPTTVDIRDRNHMKDPNDSSFINNVLDIKDIKEQAWASCAKLRLRSSLKVD